MTDIAAKYRIPAELMAFVNDGFLEVAEENPAARRSSFACPCWGMRTPRGGTSSTTSSGFIRRNAEFCDYCFKKPGDMPNFYVRIDTEHSRDRQVEGLETVDDLIDWLTSQMQEASAK